MAKQTAWTGQVIDYHNYHHDYHHDYRHDNGNDYHHVYHHDNNIGLDR